MSSRGAQAVLSRLLDEMSKGELPWRKRWNQVEVANWRSRRPYSGINVLVLWDASDRLNCPYWDTAHGIQSKGGHILKGEHATMITAMKRWSKTNAKGEAEVKTFLGAHLVFNIMQTSLASFWIEERNKRGTVDTKTPVTDMIQAYRDRHNGQPELVHGKVNYPCYRPEQDSIRIPFPEDFESVLAYQRTLTHEASHSTGHRSRLDRFKETFWVEKDEYSEEELVAEISTAMILGFCGVDIPSEVKYSAAYIQSWYHVLKDDPAILRRAASKAYMSRQCILGRPTRQPFDPNLYGGSNTTDELNEDETEDD